MKDTASAIKRQACNTFRFAPREEVALAARARVSCTGGGGLFFDPTSLWMTGAASRQCHINAS